MRSPRRSRSFATRFSASATSTSTRSASRTNWSSAQTFLATQITDLADSKKQLEELIETINIESQRAVRADVQCRPRAFPGHVPQAVRRRQGGHLSSRPNSTRRSRIAGRRRPDDHRAGEEQGRSAGRRHRNHRPSAGQAAGLDLATLRRREDDDLHRAAR